MAVFYKSAGQQRAFPPGFYLVARPKCCGLITHYGVLLTEDDRDVVFQLAPGGYAEIPYEEFRQGKPLTFHAGRSLHHAPAIMGRLRALTSNRPRYNLFHNNCEHAARWILEGKLVSTQLRGPFGRGLEFLGILPAAS